ncbi:MAG: HAD-IA family hydrolase [Anaerolineaceae bacterium]|nr:HAD-IA family hydrolase [Anaerolineaceae bacterium]
MVKAKSGKKAIIFDFDGLILDTESAELVIWTKLYAEHGLVFDEQSYNLVIGSDGTHGFDPAKAMAERPGETRSPDEIRSDMRAISYEYAQSLQPLPGVLELIGRARKEGFLIAIGSSSVDKWIHTHLSRLGLLETFDTIVTSDEVKSAKPSPDIFLKVLEKLDIPAENAIVLEDSHNGILAAHRAGIKAIAVPNPVTQFQDFSLASEVLESLVNFEPQKYFN